MDRRTLVRILGATAAVGVAGCAGGQDQGEPTDAVTPTETPMTPDTENGAAAAEPAENGLVTVESEESIEATVERVTAAIEDSPLTLLSTVDHAENAAAADLDLLPTTLLLFGNPEVGTPLMQASRSVAIDLPQKLLVWQDDDAVRITYNDPAYLAERHGIEGQSDRLDQIRAVLSGLATGEESG